MKPGDALVVEARELDALLGALLERGHTLVGPTVRDGAIVLDEIRGAVDLPGGWTDEQDGGRYRLRRREDGALFGYAVGPHSWKRYLHPPAVVRWRAHRADTGFVAEPDKAPPPRYAFVGVRPCELAAILVQDRVFLGGSFVDPAYRSRRESAFVVAVNCGSPAGTCFCASMGTGPKAGPGFDLALTECIGGGRHELVVEIGTERGAEVAGAVAHRPAEPLDLEAARAVVERAAACMGRDIDTAGLKDLLYRRYEDPRWDEVAKRCLTCVELHDGLPDVLLRHRRGRDRPRGSRHREAAASGTPASRRSSPTSTAAACAPPGGARYRQWITHKLATWHDQFGVSGCVGCGRCITWCPVGIDITEEARAVRQGETQGSTVRDHPHVREDPRGAPLLQGPVRSAPGHGRGLRRQRRLPAGRVHLPGGRARRPLLRRPRGQGGGRGLRAQQGARDDRDHRGRRDAGLVVALPALQGPLRRARAQRRACPRRSTGRACARSARRTPPSGTS